jgi:hypothetical protein
MGVPPPPGSTCGPTGPSELASCFGSVEAPAEVEAQHAVGRVRTGPSPPAVSRAPTHRRDSPLDMALPDALCGLEGVDGIADAHRSGGSAFRRAVGARHHPTTIRPLHDLGVVHLPQLPGPPARSTVLTLTTAPGGNQGVEQGQFVRERPANGRDASPIAIVSGDSASERAEALGPRTGPELMKSASDEIGPVDGAA